MLKATLHVHIKGDPDDYVPYDGFEFLDVAAAHGFEVVAFTCHERVIYTQKLREYAHKLGILLIPGIEMNLGGHVVILNADRDAESLKTLNDLAAYREKRPEIFTLAAHPYFPKPELCLGNKLVQNLPLFDGIEHSWFYSRLINYNKKAREVAEGSDIPYIATSDIHILEQIQNGHVLIDAEKNIESVLESLKQRKFISVARPQGVLGMWWTFGKMMWSLQRKVLPWTPPHFVFQHEEIPPTDQSKSETRPKTDRVS